MIVNLTLKELAILYRALDFAAYSDDGEKWMTSRVYNIDRDEILYVQHKILDTEMHLEPTITMYEVRVVDIDGQEVDTRMFSRRSEADQFRDKINRAKDPDYNPCCWAEKPVDVEVVL